LVRKYEIPSIPDAALNASGWRIARNQSMRMTIIAVLALSIVALALNTFWVDSRTRAAAPRDGGRIVDTAVVRRT